MITVNRQLLSGTPNDVRGRWKTSPAARMTTSTSPGTWFHELAVKLATRDGLVVSAVSYDDTAVQELDVTLASAPRLDAIVIDRSQLGDYCQITLALCSSSAATPALRTP